MEDPWAPCADQAALDELVNQGFNVPQAKAICGMVANQAAALSDLK